MPSSTAAGERAAWAALGGRVSDAVDINDTDKVVGSSTVSFSDNDNEHAFLYSGGQMSDLGTLGGSRSAAKGINNADKVVGFSAYERRRTADAFLYSDRQMSDLGTLGGSDSSALDINDADKVVGISSTSESIHLSTPSLTATGVMR